jgi:hypothetical protein
VIGGQVGRGVKDGESNDRHPAGLSADKTNKPVHGFPRAVGTGGLLPSEKGANLVRDWDSQ